ncbi:MAG: TraB/GumN family protein [archaeon]
MGKNRGKRGQQDKPSPQRNPEPARVPIPVPIRTRWFKRPIRKRWIAVGVVALSVIYAGVERYRTQTTVRLPTGIVSLMRHIDIEDGRTVARDFRHAVTHEKVVVLAIEQFGGTQESNANVMRSLNKARDEFEKWRSVKNRSEEEGRKEAESIMMRYLVTEKSIVYVPIFAEAMVQRIPLRFLESMPIEQANRLNQMADESVQLYQQGRVGKTLGQGLPYFEQHLAIEDIILDERNAEMLEELAQIKAEHREKGNVFAVVGRAHNEIGSKSQSSVWKSYDEERHLVPVHGDRRIPLSVRAARILVQENLIALVETTAMGISRSTIKSVFDRAARLTMEEFRELDRKCSGLTGTPLAAKLLVELQSWVRNRR